MDSTDGSWSGEQEGSRQLQFNLLDSENLVAEMQQAIEEQIQLEQIHGRSFDKEVKYNGHTVDDACPDLTYDMMTAIDDQFRRDLEIAQFADDRDKVIAERKIDSKLQRIMSAGP